MNSFLRNVKTLKIPAIKCLSNTVTPSLSSIETIKTSTSIFETSIYSKRSRSLPPILSPFKPLESICSGCTKRADDHEYQRNTANGVNKPTLKILAKFRKHFNPRKNKSKGGYHKEIKKIRGSKDQIYETPCIKPENDTVRRKNNKMFERVREAKLVQSTRSFHLLNTTSTPNVVSSNYTDKNFMSTTSNATIKGRQKDVKALLNLNEKAKVNQFSNNNIVATKTKNKVSFQYLVPEQECRQCASKNGKRLLEFFEKNSSKMGKFSYNRRNYSSFCVEPRIDLKRQAKDVEKEVVLVKDQNVNSGFNEASVSLFNLIKSQTSRKGFTPTNKYKFEEKKCADQYQFSEDKDGNCDPYPLEMFNDDGMNFNLESARALRRFTSEPKLFRSSNESRFLEFLETVNMQYGMSPCDCTRIDETIKRKQKKERKERERKEGNKKPKSRRPDIRNPNKKALAIDNEEYIMSPCDCNRIDDMIKKRQKKDRKEWEKREGKKKNKPRRPDIRKPSKKAEANDEDYRVLVVKDLRSSDHLSNLVYELDTKSDKKKKGEKGNCKIKVPKKKEDDGPCKEPQKKQEPCKKRNPCNKNYKGLGSSNSPNWAFETRNLRGPQEEISNENQPSTSNKDFSPLKKLEDSLAYQIKTFPSQQKVSTIEFELKKSCSDFHLDRKDEQNNDSREHQRGKKSQNNSSFQVAALQGTNQNNREYQLSTGQGNEKKLSAFKFYAFKKHANLPKSKMESSCKKGDSFKLGSTSNLPVTRRNSVPQVTSKVYMDEWYSDDNHNNNRRTTERPLLDASRAKEKLRTDQHLDRNRVEALQERMNHVFFVNPIDKLNQKIAKEITASPKIEIGEESKQMLANEIKKMIQPVIEKEMLKYDELKAALSRMERNIERTLSSIPLARSATSIVESRPSTVSETLNRPKPQKVYMKYPWQIKKEREITEVSDSPEMKEPGKIDTEYRDPRKTSSVSIPPNQRTEVFEDPREASFNIAFGKSKSDFKSSMMKIIKTKNFLRKKIDMPGEGGSSAGKMEASSKNNDKGTCKKEDPNKVAENILNKSKKTDTYSSLSQKSIISCADDCKKSTKEATCKKKDPWHKETPCKQDDPCKKDAAQKKEPCQKANSDKSEPCKKEDPCKKSDTCKKAESDPCKKPDSCKKACAPLPETICKIDPCDDICPRKEVPCAPPNKPCISVPAASCDDLTGGIITCNKASQATKECCKPPATCNTCTSEFKQKELACDKSLGRPKIKLQGPQTKEVNYETCQAVPQPEFCPLKPEYTTKPPRQKPVECYQMPCRDCQKPLEPPNTCVGKKPSPESCGTMKDNHGFPGMKEVAKCNHTKNEPCPCCQKETFIRIEKTPPARKTAKKEACDPNAETQTPIICKKKAQKVVCEQDTRYCGTSGYKKEEEEQRRMAEMEATRRREDELTCRKPVDFGAPLKVIPVKIESNKMGDVKSLKNSQRAGAPSTSTQKVQEPRKCTSDTTTRASKKKDNIETLNKSFVESCSNKITDLCMLIVRKQKGGKKAAPIVVTLSRSEPRMGPYGRAHGIPMVCPGGSSGRGNGNNRRPPGPGDKMECGVFDIFKSNKKQTNEKFLDIKGPPRSKSACNDRNKGKLSNQKSDPCIPCKNEDYSKKGASSQDPCKKKKEPVKIDACKKSNSTVSKHTEDGKTDDPYNCVKPSQSPKAGDGKKDDPCKKKQDLSKKKEDSAPKKGSDGNTTKKTVMKACSKDGKEKNDPCKKKEDPGKKDFCKNRECSEPKRGAHCNTTKKINIDIKKLALTTKSKEGQKEDPCKNLKPVSSKNDDKCSGGDTKVSPEMEKLNKCVKGKLNKNNSGSSKKGDKDDHSNKTAGPSDQDKKNDPCKKKEDPCKKKEDPCKKKEDPCKKKEDPCKQKEDPCKQKEDPCKQKSDSFKDCKPLLLKKSKTNAEDTCKNAMNKPIEKPPSKNATTKKLKEKFPWNGPCKDKMKSKECLVTKASKEDCQPKKAATDPCLAVKNHESHVDKAASDPCLSLKQKKEEPCKKRDAMLKKLNEKKKDDPCKKKDDAGKKKEDPCKKKEDPCKKKEDPCKKKDDAGKKKEDPCKKKEDPCKKKEDPCKKKDDPCKKKDDAGKKKEDPCKKKEDPCKKKEDPCKKKEDPCKKKEDPCKKKEDPCKKKEDPCKKKEDPCKKKEDPCKKKEDPCKKKEGSSQKGSNCKPAASAASVAKGKQSGDPRQCKSSENIGAKKSASKELQALSSCVKKDKKELKKDDSKKDDPSKKKEDPCKKKQDSSLKGKEKAGKLLKNPCEKKNSDPGKKKNDPCKNNKPTQKKCDESENSTPMICASNSSDPTQKVGTPPKDVVLNGSVKAKRSISSGHILTKTSVSQICLQAFDGPSTSFHSDTNLNKKKDDTAQAKDVPKKDTCKKTASDLFPKTHKVDSTLGIKDFCQLKLCNSSKEDPKITVSRKTTYSVDDVNGKDKKLREDVKSNAAKKETDMRKKEKESKAGEMDKLYKCLKSQGENRGTTGSGSLKYSGPIDSLKNTGGKESKSTQTQESICSKECEDLCKLIVERIHKRYGITPKDKEADTMDVYKVVISEINKTNHKSDSSFVSKAKNKENINSEEKSHSQGPDNKALKKKSDIAQTCKREDEKTSKTDQSKKIKATEIFKPKIIKNRNLLKSESCSDLSKGGSAKIPALECKISCKGCGKKESKNSAKNTKDLDASKCTGKKSKSATDLRENSKQEKVTKAKKSFNEDIHNKKKDPCKTDSKVKVDDKGQRDKKCEEIINEISERLSKRYENALKNNTPQSKNACENNTSEDKKIRDPLKSKSTCENNTSKDKKIRDPLKSKSTCENITSEDKKIRAPLKSKSTCENNTSKDKKIRDPLKSKVVTHSKIPKSNTCSNLSKKESGKIECSKISKSESKLNKTISKDAAKDSTSTNRNKKLNCGKLLKVKKSFTKAASQKDNKKCEDTKKNQETGDPSKNGVAKSQSELSKELEQLSTHIKEQKRSEKEMIKGCDDKKEDPSREKADVDKKKDTGPTTGRAKDDAYEKLVKCLYNLRVKPNNCLAADTNKIKKDGEEADDTSQIKDTTSKSNENNDSVQPKVNYLVNKCQIKKETQDKSGKENSCTKVQHDKDQKIKVAKNDKKKTSNEEIKARCRGSEEPKDKRDEQRQILNTKLLKPSKNLSMKESDAEKICQYPDKKTDVAKVIEDCMKQKKNPDDNSLCDNPRLSKSTGNLSSSKEAYSMTKIDESKNIKTPLKEATDQSQEKKITTAVDLTSTRISASCPELTKKRQIINSCRKEAPKNECMQKGLKELTAMSPGHENYELKDMGLLAQCRKMVKNRKEPIITPISDEEADEILGKDEQVLFKVMKLGCGEKMVSTEGEDIDKCADGPVERNFADGVERVLKCSVKRDKSNREKFICTELLPEEQNKENLAQSIRERCAPKPKYSKVKVISNKLVCRKSPVKGAKKEGDPNGKRELVCKIATVEEIKTAKQYKKKRNVLKYEDLMRKCRTRSIKANEEQLKKVAHENKSVKKETLERREKDG